MPLSCDEARRMLADALRSRMATRSFAQVLVSLYEVLGKETMSRLLDEFATDLTVAEAVRIAQGMFESESSWEIPVNPSRSRIPGGLVGKVRKHG